MLRVYSTDDDSEATGPRARRAAPSSARARRAPADPARSRSSRPIKIDTRTHEYVERVERLDN